MLVSALCSRIRSAVLPGEMARWLVAYRVCFADFAAGPSVPLARSLLASARTPQHPLPILICCFLSKAGTRQFEMRHKGTVTVRAMR